MKKLTKLDAIFYLYVLFFSLLNGTEPPASLISVTCFTSLLIVPSCISIQERHRTHTSTLRY